MNKGTHFNGQPMYGQLISLLDKHEILKCSREKNLVYNTLSDTMYMNPNGLMQERVQIVEFTKHTKGTGEIKHKARIITQVSDLDFKPFEHTL